MINFLYVAMGGALGAVIRYSLGLWLINMSKLFPFATLIVNILGSFLLGVLFAWQYQQTETNQQLWLFLGVGVLGAFTTFSAFSLDVVMLIQQGEAFKAIIYALTSVVACIAAVFLAMWLKLYS